MQGSAWGKLEYATSFLLTLITKHFKIGVLTFNSKSMSGFPTLKRK
jgi:hypothetical protein